MLLAQKYIFGQHLDDGEKLFEIFHRHSIEMWGRFVAWFILGVIVPLWVTYYAHSLQFFFSWWWAITWIFLSFSWILYHFIDWYFDVMLISNYSLIHVQWHGLLDREASRIEYEDIKEVTITSEGLLQAIFDYGNIQILSISGGKTVIKHIPSPQTAEQIVRRYKTNFQKFQRFTDGSEMESIMSQMVSKHVWQYGTEYGFLPRR